MNREIIIIGGGAAGMTAAVAAAETGKKVTLFERGDRLGHKLDITGKGRCNLTNNCTREEFFANIPTNPKFMYSSFAKFDNFAVMDMFERAGVPLKTERGGRVFPVSDRAHDITAALIREMDRLGVKVITSRVTGLIIEDGVCRGVTAGKEYRADSVIVACGGMSYPKTGSTGDGYEMARAAGHTVIPPVASLVPLVCEEKLCRDAMGLSLKNVRLSLVTQGKEIWSEQGEMMFTHFGVTGPLVLTASGHMRDAGRKYSLVIDLKPALDEKKLDERIRRDMCENMNRDFINSLGALLPKKLIPVVAKLSGIPFDKKVNSITHDERLALVGVMKGLTLNVKCKRPIDEAIITSGGVSVKEIDPGTMQSKLVKGLYFAGEVIDVDAYTGGFNLQIAFSTGRAAGVNA
ncbi:MAG: NAD(P)/FAD-dependent oxidoreductase [Oscillospiraceae bacterium]|nr:NAD(P)/FAD-dependent oxidoreductase [Oscillospiraceae bacterium]